MHLKCPILTLLQRNACWWPDNTVHLFKTSKRGCMTLPWNSHFPIYPFAVWVVGKQMVRPYMRTRDGHEPSSGRVVLVHLSVEQVFATSSPTSSGEGPVRVNCSGFPARSLLGAASEWGPLRRGGAGKYWALLRPINETAWTTSPSLVWILKANNCMVIHGVFFV